jgi:hypothetical protein
VLRERAAGREGEREREKEKERERESLKSRWIAGMRHRW